MLDTIRLKAELGHIQSHLARVVTGPRGGDVVEPLRASTRLRTAEGSLLWQALHNDCLRVIYVALAADNRIVDEEIEGTYEYLFSVARHYAEILPAVYGSYGALEPETARDFLACYAGDRGPFGFAGERTQWAGLDACRRAAVIGDGEPLERYASMIGWLCDAACEIGGVEANARLTEIESLRRALADLSEVAEPGTDLRVQAFLEGPRVFAAVTHADSVFEDDPFDVEEVHADVRETFERLIHQAVTPVKHTDRGRMLLVLGDSGAGKTHLMRAFRGFVHRGGHGFAAYAQMQSRAPEYGRYLLHNVIESLERRHGGAADGASGLLELARGLPRFLGEGQQRSVARLAEDDWPPGALAAHVDTLVDELLDHQELAPFDPDLLRVLLYLQCDEPRITSRVLKYLRCEDMTAGDRSWIGDVPPRLGADEPIWMMQQLARLAFVTQEAAFVIMVDQAELAGHDASTIDAFKRGVDALYAVSSAVPSVVVVIACLTEMFGAAEAGLSRSLIDRLTADPPRAMLATERTASEIAAIVGRRLEWLYDETGAVFRRDDATFPLPSALLNDMVSFRTRSVLDMCHKFQQACSAAGRLLVEGWSVGIDESIDGSDGGVQVDELERLAAEWNDCLHAAPPELPEDDDQILDLLADAAAAYQAERGCRVAVRRRDGYLEIDVDEDGQRQQLTIGISSKGPKGGAFGRELKELRGHAGSRTPIAVRNGAYPRGAATAKHLAELLKAGGRRVSSSEADLRALLAMRGFAAEHGGMVFEAWRRRDRPMSRRDSVAELFAVKPIEAPEPEKVTAKRARTPRPVEAPPHATVNPPPPPRTDPAAAGSSTPSGQLNVGLTSGLEQRAFEISPDTLLRHSGVLGSPGSGKTTLALNLVEQLLERDVAVVLVDRKGDLAGYARKDWFESIPDREARARGEALAKRLDVRLFTPGTAAGRPLAFGVVPRLDGVPEHDRMRLVTHATSALATMLRLGTSAKDQMQRAILGQAIDVLAERVPSAGLENLIDLIGSHDDDLIARASKFNPRLFAELVPKLESTRLNESELFNRSAEQLSADILLGRGPDGRTPLSIVSTRFLGDTDRVQAWTSHLFVELARHCMRMPSAKLQALVMLDEADQYMPATSKPPSKEPLMDLLKRARSGGLGVMLATQTPGDLDYKSRDLITSWFIGKIGDNRSIDKVRPLLERKPVVAGKLGQLPAEHFVVANDTTVSEIKRTASLLRTEQLPEQEIVALARANRGSRSSAGS